MAKPTLRLITALRETAQNLSSPEVTYKWSHFAHCNCGHLVRTITGLDAEAIQTRAIVHQQDWGQQARAYGQTPDYAATHPAQPDYGDRPALDEGAWEPENVGACTLTGMSLDIVFDTLQGFGLETADFQHLERLSNPDVRRRLGTNTVDYPHYERDNVIAYLRAWADLLEDELETLEPEICPEVETPAVAPTAGPELAVAS